ncbi:MAG: CAP domain-containing protein, partial [Candidatus Eremiobacterota bacterium]
MRWLPLGLLLLFLMVPVAAVPVDLEGQIFDLTNQARAEHGLPPLEWVEALSTAARGHSSEMLELDYFAHESPTPGRRSPRER